jgi:hypothetical protein
MSAAVNMHAGIRKPIIFTSRFTPPFYWLKLMLSGSTPNGAVGSAFLSPTSFQGASFQEFLAFIGGGFRKMRFPGYEGCFPRLGQRINATLDPNEPAIDIAEQYFWGIRYASF